MKALRMTAAGREPVLQDVEMPAPGPGEVRLAVRAAGLNFADLLMIGGSYQDTPGMPFTLGLEAAGIVDAVGPGVTAPAPGTRVAATMRCGALAGFAIVAAEHCTTLPEGVAFEQAAASQIAYGTAHLSLSRRAALAPGETLLVLGASGGAGLAAVEVGRLMGARVVACARGRRKAAAAAAAGAETVLDSDAPDLRDRLRDLGGVDVVFDAVGGQRTLDALGACRPEARLLLIGFASGTVPQIKANHLLVKNVSAMGFYWGAYRGFAPAALSDSLARIFGWIAAGRLNPHLDRVLPLDRTREGLEALRGRRVTGKIVVTP